MEEGKKKVVLNDGYEVTIDSELLDDWDFLETLREIDKGNLGLIVDVMPMMLGDDQFAALKAHLRNENGKLKATDMGNVLKEILNATNETKNS